MRKTFLVLALAAAGCSHVGRTSMMAGEVLKFVRFEAGGTASYGIVEGSRVRAITAAPYEAWQKTDRAYPLAEVKLLVPVEARKVFALAGTYKSHLGTRPASPNPEVFFKLPTCLVPTGAEIVIPPGTADVHYEAELVIVIGKRAKNVSPEQAKAAIFGFSCGNDVSARDWQKADRQWWRAKGSDTFGPLGPYVVSGIDGDDLGMELRLNGEVKQKCRTSELIHNCAAQVAWISRHVTLEPGDVVFTGTSGQTTPIKPGDVVEVEIEGIGVLRNRVAAAP